MMQNETLRGKIDPNKVPCCERFMSTIRWEIYVYIYAWSLKKITIFKKMENEKKKINRWWKSDLEKRSLKRYRMRLFRTSKKIFPPSIVLQTDWCSSIFIRILKWIRKRVDFFSFATKKFYLQIFLNVFRCFWFFFANAAKKKLYSGKVKIHTLEKKFQFSLKKLFSPTVFIAR
jgi:hypothetical protein